MPPAGPARRHGERRVAAYIAALVAIATALWLPLQRAGAVPNHHLHPPLLVLGLAFGAAQVLLVHHEVGGEAAVFTLADVPLVVALATVAPPHLLVARVAGAGVAIVAVHRLPLRKVAFNLASVALEVGVAVVTYHLVLHGGAPLSPRGWLAAYLAVQAAGVTSHGAVLGVLTLSGSRPSAAQTRRLGATAVLTGLLNASLGLLALFALWLDGRAAVVLGVAALLLWVVYRGYTALQRRHEQLGRLYTFTRSLNDAAGRPELLVPTILSQACELLGSDVAELVMLDGAGMLRSRRHADGALELGVPLTDDPLVARIVASPTAVVVPRAAMESMGPSLLGDRTLRDLVAVPLREESTVIGALVVGDRSCELAEFGRDDSRLIEALANHASASLRSAHLLDRLRAEAADKHYQSTHDTLTGLGNRTLFATRLSELVTNDGDVHAVVLCDLDGFREVNDTLGNRVGDHLLREVGRRLVRAAGAGATVARLAGDEFAVLFGPLAGPADALVAVRALKEQVEEPIYHERLTLSVAVSIGVALAPEHGTDAARLLPHADVALAEAKRLHTGVESYSPDHDHGSVQRLALAADLREAIESGQLHLYYQPKADLASGRVSGVEALVRWAHPRLGFVMPDQFISLAEQSGLIRPLTSYVLSQALQQLEAWRAAGLHISMAVNLSPRSLLDVGLPDEVGELLARFSVPAPSLTLEVTESSVMTDVDRSIGVLARLSALGVRLSVDDFGTGYSSMAQLKRLPVDEMKIDKAFVLNMATDPSDAAIVRSCVELGHNLGLVVVAEGVEDSRTWDRLVDAGCDVAQGYHLTRPVPPSRFLEWLGSWAAGTTQPAPPVRLRMLPVGADSPPASGAGRE